MRLIGRVTLINLVLITVVIEPVPPAVLFWLVMFVSLLLDARETFHLD